VEFSTAPPRAGETPTHRNDPSPWLGVIHGEESAPQVEYFSLHGSYNALYVALMNAVG
jgi:hypothetical protein